jgi:hypothetical protein
MKAMRKQDKQDVFIIRTPFPTTDEVIEMMGVSKKRRAELEKFYAEVMAEMEAEDRRKRTRLARAKKKSKRSA